ncbi:MAG: ribosomal protein S18-alanine N-acetyltransferase [Tumebacillaceae bacterium]
MNASALLFRRMVLSDIDRVMEIEPLCFTAPWSREAYYAELTQNHFARYMVAELAGEVIGYGGMWVIIDEAHVTNIAIHPDYQGRNYGERLMLTMIAQALSHGVRHMTLEVRVSNRTAQKLYEKMGFARQSIRQGYYTDNNEDAIVMWAELPAVVVSQEMEQGS